MGSGAIGTFPEVWRTAIDMVDLDAVLDSIEAAVAVERARSKVYPKPDDVFAALRLTAPADVRAVIIGQDPYHGPGQAHGLAFSVRDGCHPLPPSLRNIRSELHDDCGGPLPESGSLTRWAEHGVLLLNAILTVTKGIPGSHRKFGWQTLTRAIIGSVEANDRPIAFLLWGRFAQAIAGPINTDRHVVVNASHPSPLSASNGFLGTRPFSTANRQLQARGAAGINWSLRPSAARARNG